MRTSHIKKAGRILIVGILVAPAAQQAFGQVCELHEVRKLIASDGDMGDYFGRSAAISGDRAIIGAYLDGDVDFHAGSAYVLRRDDNGTPLDPRDDLWIEEAKLYSSDLQGNDYFGRSVAISGSRAIAGAPTGAPLMGTGSAYVFRHDQNGTPLDPSDDLWVQEAKLTPSGATGVGLFGEAVSIDGNRVVVGAPLRTGAAYVFRLDDNATPSNPTDDTWVEEAKLTASDAADLDTFGHSVSINGDRIIVGAHNNEDAGTDSGSAYVFRREDQGTPSDPTDDIWVEEAKLLSSDLAEGDQFGSTVSISGDWAIVGAALNDDTGGGNSGSAYIFHRDDNGTPADPTDDVWVEESNLTASDAEEADFFGGEVSIDGDRVAISARSDDDACPSDPWCDSGSVYVFSRDDLGTPQDPTDDVWREEMKLTASDADRNHRLGISASISGEWVVMGSWSDGPAGDASGSAYMFAVDRPDCNENFVPDECDIADGTSDDANEDGIPDECEVVRAFLDIKPGSCPNPLNIRSRGVLPTAVLGTETLDVTEIDFTSLTLTRADGVGGAVQPIMKRPGHGAKIEDVGTPFEGEFCGCHELACDGIDDLLLKFSREEIVRTLELGSMPRGTQVELTLIGSLLDGTMFEASDCIVTKGKPRNKDDRRRATYREPR